MRKLSRNNRQKKISLQNDKTLLPKKKILLVKKKKHKQKIFMFSLAGECFITTKIESIR